MKISQNLNLKLAQKMVLSHEMLQYIDLIQLPVLDLTERINKEVLENPALEITDKARKKDDLENLDSIENSFNLTSKDFDDSSSAQITTGVNESSTRLDTKRQFLEGALSREETLLDKLLWQLQLLEITEEQKRIGETIIRHIDENGFFKEDLLTLFPGDPENAFDVLEMIQTFDPPGVASKDVQEALLFQIESLPEQDIDSVAYKIVQDYFELMISRKDSKIIKELKINSGQLKKALDFIGTFDPYPGRKYDSSTMNYIIPDAFVYKVEDELMVEINDDVIPDLTISAYMDKIAGEAKNKKKLDKQKKYIVQNVNNARKFMQVVQQRNQSLFNVVLAIITFQRDFFFKGPKSLKPLTMKQVAEEIGLSESTVSRLASSKYIQTEWGIHEIKYFFSSAIAVAGGGPDGTSSESVREIIKEIIESNKGKKISDQKIADILNNRGISIARRTVAKYRKMLNILPSNQRNI